MPQTNHKTQVAIYACVSTKDKLEVKSWSEICIRLFC